MDAEPQSNILYEVADANPERLGNPPKRRQRNVFFAALHSPEVIRMQISFFRQNLLRETRTIPPLTDGRTQNDSIIGS